MPVTVRQSVRAKLRNHLENPPGYCLCHKFDRVDQFRLRLAERLREPGETPEAVEP